MTWLEYIGYLKRRAPMSTNVEKLVEELRSEVANENRHHSAQMAFDVAARRLEQALAADREGRQEWTEQEETVITELMRKQELSRHAVLRQGLRLYQMHVEGLVSIPPLAAQPIPLTGAMGCCPTCGGSGKQPIPERGKRTSATRGAVMDFDAELEYIKKLDAKPASIPETEGVRQALEFFANAEIYKPEVYLEACRRANAALAASRQPETEGVRQILEKHDLRRWLRQEANGKFEYLRCYCGEKIFEDSNEAMFGHVAAALAASRVAEPLTGEQLKPIFDALTNLRDQLGSDEITPTGEVLDEAVERLNSIIELLENTADLRGRVAEGPGVPWNWIPYDKANPPEGIVYVWDADWNTEYLAMLNSDGDWEAAVDREPPGKITHWAKRASAPARAVEFDGSNH